MTFAHEYTAIGEIAKPTVGCKTAALPLAHATRPHDTESVMSINDVILASHVLFAFDCRRSGEVMPIDLRDSGCSIVECRGFLRFGNSPGRLASI